MTTPAASRKPRVLVVDDNRDLAENIGEILEEAGYQVLLAGSCHEATEKAQGGLEVALVDLKLPDGDGTSLAKALKERWLHAEVILLTGYATLESATAAVRSGAWAYLVKPCATPELLLTVEQALRHVRVQTEKQELARRASVAEKLALVGTLTAGLTHEIRNPLNGALLQLEVLERRVRKVEEAIARPLLEPLHLVRDEIRRLDHVLEDFLQFARPVQFSPRPVDLKALLEKVASFLQEDAASRKVTLHCECQSTTLISGDEGRLRQVFMNLALNALDAASEGGHVKISCLDSLDSVMAFVDDDGPGIAQEKADRIFEPFFTTKAKGSGLGLPICNAIITQHGGVIEVSASPLGGARFGVRFPMAV